MFPFYPTCDHCGGSIFEHQKVFHVGRKTYHRKCAFAKEGFSGNVEARQSKQRKDDPRIKR